MFKLEGIQSHRYLDFLHNQDPTTDMLKKYLYKINKSFLIVEPIKQLLHLTLGLNRSKNLTLLEEEVNKIDIK